MAMGWWVEDVTEKESILILTKESLRYGGLKIVCYTIMFSRLDPGICKSTSPEYFVFIYGK